MTLRSKARPFTPTTEAESGRYRVLVDVSQGTSATVAMGRLPLIALTAFAVCVTVAGCAPESLVTAPNPTPVPIRVTPTPEPPEAVSVRIATVEAGAQEARLVPGYAATQTCERFRSSINGCRTHS